MKNEDKLDEASKTLGMLWQAFSLIYLAKDSGKLIPFLDCGFLQNFLYN